MVTFTDKTDGLKVRISSFGCVKETHVLQIWHRECGEWVPVDHGADTSSRESIAKYLRGSMPVRYWNEAGQAWINAFA
jgi:hypothetical protein